MLQVANYVCGEDVQSVEHLREVALKNVQMAATIPAATVATNFDPELTTRSSDGLVVDRPEMSDENQWILHQPGTARDVLKSAAFVPQAGVTHR